MIYRSVASFGSFGTVKKDSSDADIVVLPIGFEATSSYFHGCKFGPCSILDASHYMETYDIELDFDVSEKVSLYTAPEPEFSKDSMTAAMHDIEKYIRSFAGSDNFLIVLGGEHSITPPIVKVFAEKYSNLSVLHFDAHTDLRDTYDGTSLSHACPMRRCMEMCSVTHVGIRSMCSEEARLIRKNNLAPSVFYAKDAARWNIDDIINSLADNVYISFDFDCFDPSIMPAVGTPEPGGLGWYETLAILRRCFERKNVVACDAVELCPSASPGIHSSFSAALLIYKMISYKFADRKSI